MTAAVTVKPRLGVRQKRDVSAAPRSVERADVVAPPVMPNFWPASRAAAERKSEAWRIPHRTRADWVVQHARIGLKHREQQWRLDQARQPALLQYDRLHRTMEYD